ncbi:aminopeptidase P family protein [Pantanalinema sp. GBBB05]|uniref:aminopeptidase P family protein n=1 Tax=Pantanalinema sp. GBBB05 TaxID=2604139 RepID=UPI001D5D66F7|nr:aminopeptidase P family protein [Pantanalinema sp. GBBB05]
MQTLGNRQSLAAILKTRRQKLAEQVSCPVILWSGRSSARNFPANVYPFRASSHFLYFAGLPLENAVIRLEAGQLLLFMDDASPDSALWHGESPNRGAIAAEIGADEALPLSELRHWLAGTGTIAVQDPKNYFYQASLLERMLAPATRPQNLDLEVTKAIITLRLSHDQAALAEIRQAAQVSIQAHRAGMAATRNAQIEAAVRAEIEAVFTANQMTCAYGSIVTVHGEVLHNDRYHHALRSGDLLLVDAGAETATGWAADITRTWPVSGQFSPTQRAIYDVVLAAHDACIAAIRPGVEYREIHLLGARMIAAGLIDLGILKGQPDDLVEQDAHALFFPHGIGHLLGLDVHDMEDLGDQAGYAEGRTRSDRFGLGYLRLDRPLQTGMVVTIEPGFYQVPAILNDPERRARYQDVVSWERLTQFSDVRGIRIEDDVLVTTTGSEVLTADLPTTATAIEEIICA